MAGENTVTTLSGYFYEIYAPKLEDARPKAVKLQKDVAFDADRKPGGTYHQPVLLRYEQGFTYEASGVDAVTLDLAVAAESKDATILGTQQILRSRVGYEAAARAASDKQVFRRITETLVENMWEASSKRLEINLFNGQRALGKIASIAGSVLTITTAEWAPGNWSGMENAKIVASSSVAAATTMRGTDTTNGDSMTITAVDLDARTVTVGTLTTGTVAGDFLWWKTSRTNTGFKEFLGLDGVANSSGSLFGIDNTSFSLWKPTSYAVGSTSLTFQHVNKLLARAMSKGLDDDTILYINPSTWADLLANEVAVRRHNEGGRANYKVGANGIEFYTQTGMVTIKASTYVKEGYGYLIDQKKYKRVGATDITFRIQSPASLNEFFLHDPSVTAYELRNYSNQALFTKSAGRTALLTGIVNAA